MDGANVDGTADVSGVGPVTPTLRQTVAADFGAATGWKVMAVVALLAWMAFQWGFGNDVILPSVAANGFDTVDDGETWARGALAVAAAATAGGAFWALTQALDAVVVLAGVRLVPRITGRLSAHLRGRGWVTPYAEMRWTTRWMISYATGVSVLCLVDVFATGRHGVRHRLGLIATAVALSAGTVALVVAAVVTAAMVATRVPATAGGAEVFIRFAKNPLTWIVIFTLVFLVGRFRGRDRGRRRSRPDQGFGSPEDRT